MALRDPVDEWTRTGASGQSGTEPDWLANVLRLARDLEIRLADPSFLRQVVADLLEVGIDRRCTSVTGASRLGDQLAGAVAAASDGKIGLWAHNGIDGTVLVIEGHMATGTQMAAMAQRARDAGALRVVGAAVLADPSAGRFAAAETADEVIALSEV